MSAESSSPVTGAVNGIRTFLGVSGVIALIVGVLILVWPAKSAVVFTLIIAIYAIIAGIVYLAGGIFSKTLGGWARAGHVLVGLLFIVAGIIAFTNPALSTATFATIVVIFVGITWLVEGVVALTTLGGVQARGWTIFFAIISIIAGVMIILSPLYAATFLWIYLGIALVVMGVVQIVRAFRFAK